jgi:hypothetical protein
MPSGKCGHNLHNAPKCMLEARRCSPVVSDDGQGRGEQEDKHEQQVVVPSAMCSMPRRIMLVKAPVQLSPWRWTGNGAMVWDPVPARITPSSRGARQTSAFPIAAHRYERFVCHHLRHDHLINEDEVPRALPLWRPQFEIRNELLGGAATSLTSPVSGSCRSSYPIGAPQSGQRTM